MNGLAVYTPFELNQTYKLFSNKEYTIIKNGWPDITAINENNGEVEFHEYKSYGKNLTDVQVECHRILERLGFKVYLHEETSIQKKARLKEKQKNTKLPNILRFHKEEVGRSHREDLRLRILNKIRTKILTGKLRRRIH